ncbi:MAG TPA: asparaginase [Candidatus Tumulicola sp.]
MTVEITRGDLVESLHRVSACAVDAAGSVIFSRGDVDVPIYLRSSAKPFIAGAIVAAGAVERFGFDEREVAVIAASHYGEPFHVEAVRSILSKIGLDENALQCGPQMPYDEASARAMIREGIEPTPIYNNCSGKHAGILALSLILGADVATYLELHHPAQQRILEFCARAHDDDAKTWPIGIDGCGIPVYATSLRKAALAFARLADPSRYAVEEDARALAIVANAMRAHPQYVSGTRQLDTVLMQTCDDIVCKSGAEGVHGAGVVRRGIGYASKVTDGNGRARGPATVSALRALGAIDAAAFAKLQPYAEPAITNWAGYAVGEVRARGFEAAT